jgi:large subunit ribosomal protein L9
VKVIFIADVPNVALAGQTKEVANGYARNFLFPRKLAVLASSQTAAVIESHVKKAVKQREIVTAEMTELAKKIDGVEITHKAKVHEKDKLYGSVTSSDIAEALSKEIDREIDKRKVDLAEPIRTVGVYDVTIKLTHDVTAMVTVTVMSDEEGAERPVRVSEAEAPPEEVKEEKPEKAEKKEKKEKEEEEKPPEAKKEKVKKPAKEKKTKAKKSAKEEKKEKKPKAKKTEEVVEEKKESVEEKKEQAESE